MIEHPAVVVLCLANDGVSLLPFCAVAMYLALLELKFTFWSIATLNRFVPREMGKNAEVARKTARAKAGHVEP